MKTRQCSHCRGSFGVMTRGDNARKYCSEKCSKRAAAKKTKLWMQAHPEAMETYNQKRVAKNPGVWIEKHRKERGAILEALGGHCVVPHCRVARQCWLHVDFLPTTRDRPFRHPRHPGYILKHLSEFRLLCANHHYELTLTGAIEGTNIKCKNRRR